MSPSQVVSAPTSRHDGMRRAHAVMIALAVLFGSMLLHAAYAPTASASTLSTCNGAANWLEGEYNPPRPPYPTQSANLYVSGNVPDFANPALYFCSGRGPGGGQHYWNNVAAFFNTYTNCSMTVYYDQNYHGTSYTLGSANSGSYNFVDFSVTRHEMQNNNRSQHYYTCS